MRKKLNEYIQQEMFPDMYFNIKYKKINLLLDNKILTKIKHECSDIIKEYVLANKILFRGTRSERMTKISDNIFDIKPRKHRRPKDTPLQYQEEIDEVFFYKFGWKPRAEGVFTSPSCTTAAGYGAPYVFLPVNGYKYLWSPKYGDLYSDFFENEYSDPNEYDIFMSGGYWQDVKTGEDWHYQSTIPRIVMSSIEHNDDGTKFTADLEDRIDKKITHKHTFIWIPYMTEEEWEVRYGHILEDAVDTYKDNSLVRAIKSDGGEIMFKCDHYYLISLGEYEYGSFKGIKPKDIGLA